MSSRKRRFNGKRLNKPGGEYRRILICTEGEVTEVQYFQQLVQKLNISDLQCKVEGPDGTDPLSVLDKAIRKARSAYEDGNPYSEIYCVVDVDDSSRRDNLERAVREALSSRVAGVPVHMVVTNLKFEVWLLWHFGEDPAKGSSFDSVKIDEKIKALPAKFMTEKRRKHIGHSFPFENYQKASERAYKRDPNLDFNRVGEFPSSAVPLLIERITGSRP